MGQISTRKRIKVRPPMVGHSGEKKIWGQSESNICTLCNLLVETSDHVLKCKHEETVKVRNQLLHEMKNKIKSCDTYPLLQRWMMILFHQWLGDFPISYPETKEIENIKEAILEQNALCTDYLD